MNIFDQVDIYESTSFTEYLRTGKLEEIKNKIEKKLDDWYRTNLQALINDDDEVFISGGIIPCLFDFYNTMGLNPDITPFQFFISNYRDVPDIDVFSISDRAQKEKEIKLLSRVYNAIDVSDRVYGDSGKVFGEFKCPTSISDKFQLIGFKDTNSKDDKHIRMRQVINSFDLAHVRTVYNIKHKTLLVGENTAKQWFYKESCVVNDGKTNPVRLSKWENRGYVFRTQDYINNILI